MKRDYERRYNSIDIAYSIAEILNNLLIFFSSICTLSFILWLLKYCHYGFDITDEGFYLNWIANPFIYNASVTQFGYLYNPIFNLLSGDIATLRQFNILIIFFTAWTLTCITLKKFFKSCSLGSVSILVISSGFATTSLLYLDIWLPTPNYNSLALLAILLTGIGILVADSEISLQRTVGSILIGAGGWLAFMAKPTTAIFLVFCVVIHFLVVKKNFAQIVLTSALTSITLLIVSAIAIDGTIHNFFDRLFLGLKYVGYLNAGHTFKEILRIDSFHLNPLELLLFIIFSSYLLLNQFLFFSNKPIFIILGFFLSFFLCSAILFLHFELFNIVYKFGKFQWFLLLSVSFSTIAISFISFRKKILKRFSKRDLSLVIIFFIFPLGYVLGTNNNYWQMVGGAGIFWILPCLIIFSPLIQNKYQTIRLIPLVIGAQIVVTCVMETSLEKPYRQSKALRLNNSPLEIGRIGSSLFVPSGLRDLLENGATVAKKAGFLDKTPIIDLTGQSPGLLYALNAKSIGLAWMIGGYPGSLKLATAALEYVSCDELTDAWLLLEESPRSISADLLSHFGIDLIHNYQPVVSWIIPNGIGGSNFDRQQYLMKPSSINRTITNCAR